MAWAGLGAAGMGAVTVGGGRRMAAAPPGKPARPSPGVGPGAEDVPGAARGAGAGVGGVGG
ncbi:MAG TPA: hypothetical protein VKT76_04475 [Bradyrhizobium sp.]|nr:hypothetical protein [Bradyrhizobium sp.]